MAAINGCFESLFHQFAQCSLDILFQQLSIDLLDESPKYIEAKGREKKQEESEAQAWYTAELSGSIPDRVSVCLLASSSHQAILFASRRS